MSREGAKIVGYFFVAANIRRQSCQYRYWVCELVGGGGDCLKAFELDKRLRSRHAIYICYETWVGVWKCCSLCNSESMPLITCLHFDLVASNIVSIWRLCNSNFSSRRVYCYERCISQSRWYINLECYLTAKTLHLIDCNKRERTCGVNKDF